MTGNAIRIELDAEAQAAYVAVSDGEVASTQALTESVLVDLDAMGMVVGIEVLSLDTEIPFARLEGECHVHSSVIDVLSLIKPNVGAFVLMTTSGAEGIATGTVKSGGFVAA
jgi:uncharacterized protein YuzE